jgi:hypothetical protein
MLIILFFVLGFFLTQQAYALPIRNTFSLIKTSSTDSISSIAPVPRTKRKKGLFSENSLIRRLAREAKSVFSSELEKLTLQVHFLLFFVVILF